MTDANPYGEFETTWCPGCGNFAIRKAMVAALMELGLPPHKVVFSTGIGQAAKAPHYIRANLLNGLHGRSLPAATGIKLANPELTVFAESGDGCSYGEGGNHFLAAIRRSKLTMKSRPRPPSFTTLLTTSKLLVKTTSLKPSSRPSWCRPIKTVITFPFVSLR